MKFRGRMIDCCIMGRRVKLFSTGSSERDTRNYERKIERNVLSKFSFHIEKIDSSMVIHFHGESCGVGDI